MLNCSRLAAILAVAFVAVAGAAPAQAQATRTWISSVGNDAGPCSRSAPCKTFAGAYGFTAVGGEIDCIDASGYGSLTINHAITLDCGGGIGGQVGSILVANTNGITINAGAADNIKIRNLSINGLAGGGFPGISGIRFNTGASLVVEHVAIFGFGAVGNSPAVAGSGIDFRPSAAGSKLITRDVEIQNNLANGVTVAPVSGVAASATLDNTMLVNNAIGLSVGDGGTVTLAHSNSSDNNKGVVVNSSTAAAVANVFNTVVASNSVAGVQTSGATSTVTLMSSGIYNNGTGILSPSGAVVSFSTNAFGTNAGNAGGATSTVPPL